MNVDGSILSDPIDKCRWVSYHTRVATKELPMLRQRGACCELPKVRESWANQTSELMKALADSTRLTMLASLWKADAPICICDFTAGLELTQPTISHHMAKLKEAGLVESQKRGIWVYYRLRDKLAPETRRLLEQLIG
jgi:ArsR family transcriptional regulator, arsenate/arsenite/antimonite-responsive transcriptional repressor